jgi:hypothetical protein
VLNNDEREGFSSSFPVLIIAYRRFGNLETLIQVLLKLTQEKIYIALDGPKPLDDQGKRDCSQVLEVVDFFSAKYPDRIVKKVRSTNVGSAVNVIGACDWFFSQENFGIILEDDCLVRDSFFKFVSAYTKLFHADSRIVMICGTQFAPAEIAGNFAMTSRYPLIWGWATSKEKWTMLRKGFARNNSEFPKSLSKDVSTTEKVYWNSGARRAFSGHIDAWDIIIARNMLRDGMLSILPNRTLVSNIGNDAYSTHTKNDSPWLNQAIDDLSNFSDVLAPNPSVDFWLKNNFYKIRIRHLLTTQLTRLKDVVFKPNKKLVLRLRLDSRS